MPAPAGLDAGTASQLIPGVRPTFGEGAMAKGIPLDRVIVSLSRADAGALLRYCAKSIDAGFTPEDAEQLADRIAQLADDDDVLIEPRVQFGGREQPFIANAFGEAGERCEVLFIAESELADVIEGHAMQLPNAELRRLPGRNAPDE